MHHQNARRRGRSRKLFDEKKFNLTPFAFFPPPPPPPSSSWLVVPKRSLFLANKKKTILRLFSETFFNTISLSFVPQWTCTCPRWRPGATTWTTTSRTWRERPRTSKWRTWPGSVSDKDGQTSSSQNCAKKMLIFEASFEQSATGENRIYLGFFFGRRGRLSPTLVCLVRSASLGTWQLRNLRNYYSFSQTH